MPDTIYDGVDESILKDQSIEILELCPLALDGEFGPIDSGVKFVQSGNFFASGNEYQIPVTAKENGQEPPGSVWHKQGYKIHVSVHPNQAVEVTKALLPLFDQTSGGSLGGVHYKVAELNSYTYDKEELQRGKFITVYAKDEDQLKQIAEELEKKLITSGISGQSHGGKISNGDQELGTSGMISMRWGQFGGLPEKQVFVKQDGVEKFVTDERSVPCPPSKQQEFDRVVQETNTHMQMARQSLGQLQDQSQMTGPSRSTSYSGPRDSFDESPSEERKKKVIDSLRDESESTKKSRRYGVRIDTDSLRDALKDFKKPDDPGGSSGGGTSVKQRTH